MDTLGFREVLRQHDLNEKKMAAATALALRFEAYIADHGSRPDTETTWSFCKLLSQEGEDTHDNLLALARYGQFIKNDEVYIAIRELLDGGEAQPNLYTRVGEIYGTEMRDKVFSGTGPAPLGTPPTERPQYVFPTLERLTAQVGRPQVEKLLSSCLRDLPDADFTDERQLYRAAGDIDTYLAQKREALLQTLRKCQQDGELYFAQAITDEVLEFVESNPEIGGGVRDGSLLYETKIPYQARQYLAEQDPDRKRYFACHCPWAREAIRNGAVHLDSIFCNCSAGFSKKPWEVIFGQPLEAEVLESALQGDPVCRFAIHLPEKLTVED